MARKRAWQDLNPQDLNVTSLNTQTPMSGMDPANDPDHQQWQEAFKKSQPDNSGGGQMSRANEASFDWNEQVGYFFAEQLGGYKLDNIKELHQEYPNVFDKLKGGGSAPSKEEVAELNKIIGENPENAREIMQYMDENKWIFEGENSSFSVSQEDMIAAIKDPSLIKFDNISEIANDPELGVVFHHMRNQMSGGGEMTLADAKEMNDMFGQDMEKTREVFTKIKGNYEIFGEGGVGFGDPDVSKAMMKMAFDDPENIDRFVAGKKSLEKLSDNAREMLSQMAQDIKNGNFNLEGFIEKIIGMLETAVAGVTGDSVNGSSPAFDKLLGIGADLAAAKLGVEAGPASNDPTHNGPKMGLTG